MTTGRRTALVTGATSGLGLETAAQLVLRDEGPVIITGRTQAKADAARDALIERTGRTDIDTLVLDNDRMASVEAAARTLRERGAVIDLLILNAGMAPADLDIGPDGIELTMASSVTGHHVLTMRLFEYQLIGADARIVIASSEAARGDVRMFHPVDFHALADASFGGDLEAAIEAQIRVDPPTVYNAGDQYATAKTLVAWWAAELAERAPRGVRVNAVSPGSTPETNAIRNAPFLMRYVLMPMFRFMPGMSHGVSDGAGRYLEVAEMEAAANGQAFASPPGKLIGPLVRMEQPHILDPESQTAGWQAVVNVSGVDYPAVDAPMESPQELPLAA